MDELKITACNTMLLTVMVFYLNDGRHIVTPLFFTPKLADQDVDVRADFTISPDGQTIRWNKAGFEVSLKELLNPKPLNSSPVP